MSLVRSIAFFRSTVAGIELRTAASRCAVFSAILLIFAALVFTSSGNAQIGGTGSLQGTVTDPSGAVIANAVVTATNTATNAVSTQKTSDAGFYSIAALRAGTYTVEVSGAGFQRLSQQNVVIDALAVATVNLALTIGSNSDTVTVTEAPPQIETSNATLGQVMRNELYTSLPLAMNAGPRDPTAFVALVPGVQALSSQAAGSSFASFNGGQPYMNEVYIEGIPMTNAAAQGETRNLAYSVSVEAIDQFQVETNNSPAMYQGQGIENYTIKSGANTFHGAAYEYFRNTVLDARGYFPTFRQPEKQNQFGGRIGGFILRDKLFFFGNYDGYRYRSTSNPTQQSVPNTDFLNGNFSALLNIVDPATGRPAPQIIYDPLTTVCNPACSRSPFPGNIIPASRISAVSRSLASYLPKVDPSAGFGNNYTAIVPVGLNTNSTTERLDYNYSQRQRLCGLLAGQLCHLSVRGNLERNQRHPAPLCRNPRGDREAFDDSASSPLYAHSEPPQPVRLLLRSACYPHHERHLRRPVPDKSRAGRTACGSSEQRLPHHQLSDEPQLSSILGGNQLAGFR